MEKAIKTFNQYIKQFNLKDKAIMQKYHHTFRVLEYALKIAQSLDLSSKDINIVGISALLHDIGRFYQIENYHTYSDTKSIDHGKKGYEILCENDFINKYIDYDQNIVLNAVLNHNKLEIDDRLDEKTKFITKIVRDADKIDILLEQVSIIKDLNPTINKNIIDEFLKENMIKNDLVINDCDDILHNLAFIYDLNFKKSFEIVLDSKVIENKINLLEIYINEDLSFLKESLFNYINRRFKNEKN